MVDHVYPQAEYVRIATLETLRNAQRCTISWHFTSQDARATLPDLYPAIISD